MTSIRILIFLLLLVPDLAFAQKKELVEVQRDIALLQDQIRNLQRTLDENFTKLNLLVQQALDAANRNNTAVAVLDSALRDRFRDQEKTLAGPVAAVGSKVDQMSNEFQALRTEVADLAGRMGKLQNQIVDLGNAVKILSAPPAPPPSASPNTPPAGVSAESLYNNAMRDRTSGNSDLAIQQFTDYLRYFGSTDLAPNAQYYIGEILYTKGDFEAALQAFDTVLEKFPENNKTPDAMFMKGRTLAKSNQRNAAAEEYRELIKKYPAHEAAGRAKAELKSLGLSVTPPKKRSK